MVPRRPRRQRGQVLVETAIVMPIMIFVVLGALQLMLMQHARVMTEYAAYNAARAGVVNNANWNVMRNAAMIAALPIYERTDTFGNFLLAWAKIKILNEATELVDTTGATLETVVNDLLGVNIASGFLPDLSLVEVEVTSPTEREFEAWEEYVAGRTADSVAIDGVQGRLAYPEKEIDFDDQPFIMETPGAGRLAVEVRVLVPLRVPLVNWIIWQMWYAHEELRLLSLRSDLTDWAAFRTRVPDGRTLEEVVEDSEGTQVFDDAFLNNQRTKEARMLRDLATGANRYVVPMRASYAMQMQSNPFWDNRREPVWFSFE